MVTYEQVLPSCLDFLFFTIMTEITTITIIAITATVNPPAIAPAFSDTFLSVLCIPALKVRENIVHAT
jgi:hypothetical protein